MRLTYKYRLFPTAAQRTAMRRALDACCWVYNKALVVDPCGTSQECSKCGEVVRKELSV